MEKTIERICDLLKSSDGMRRCAAAMVLGELAPHDPAVVKALGEALQDGSQLLTKYVLEAFEAIGTKAVVPHVLPLLDADDMELKMRAASIVSRVGGDMLGELKKRFDAAPPMQKRLLIDIIARMHSRPAMQVVLDTLFQTDFELVKETCQAVRRHINTASPAERKALHKQVVQFMNSAAVKKNDRVLTSCVILVGYIAAPDAAKELLKLTGPRQNLYVRQYALVGLKGMEHAGAAAGMVARTMIGYLGEPDYANIVQHALDNVERLPLPPSYASHWRKLLQNEHPGVRAFAARKLAAIDSTDVNKLMVALLAHPDTQVSEVAAGALARHTTATKLLLDLIVREKNADKVWRLAKILKPHGERVDKSTRKKFSFLAGKTLEADDPRCEAYFYFLRNLDPSLADHVLLDAGRKFKAARKWNRAVQCLKQLAATDLFDADIRYDLSVANLKLSPKDLGLHLRGDDHALRGFQALLADKHVPLMDRLVKDKTLDASDLFFVGFHFAEGHGPERDFGTKLLEHVAKKWPASKDGKAAKNKLKLAAQPAPRVT